MSWTFGWRSREELVSHVTSERFLAAGYTMLVVRMAGNNIWYLYSRPDGAKSIGLAMIRGIRKHGDSDWGYNSFVEDDGPFQFNCPETLIQQADPAATAAAELWRSQVAAYHASRRARPTYCPGQVWRFGDEDFQLVQSAGKARGWVVLSEKTGNRYRLTARQLSQSTLVTQPPAV